MVHRVALFLASLTAAIVLAAGLALAGLAPAGAPAVHDRRRGAGRHGPGAGPDRPGRHRLRHPEGQAQAHHHHEDGRVGLAVGRRRERARGWGRLMTEPRPVRDPADLPPRPRDASRPPPPRPARPPDGPRPGQGLRSEPARRRPDPGSLRVLVLFTGIASASALATAMLPSVAPPADAGNGSTPGTQPASVADAPAPSVRHVKRYVLLKPGQTRHRTPPSSFDRRRRRGSPS